MISISIIIPVFRVENYIQRCLESVIAQDKVNAHIECIIIDDSSDDRSMELVHHIIDNYRGKIIFKVVQHEHNKGLSAARNTGIRCSKGDYVFFIDSDDYLVENSFQYFLDNLKLYPNADMVVGNAENCKVSSLLLTIDSPQYVSDNDTLYNQLFHHQVYLYAWNKLIRRKLLVDNDINFIDGILYEDQPWSYKLFSYLKSILLLPKVTYIYVYNPSSIINTTFYAEKAEKVLYSYAVGINSMLDAPPTPEKFSKNLTVDYLLFMANFLMNGVDILSRFHISKDIAQLFWNVRKRLILQSLRYFRILPSFFLLLLFSPFYYIQRWSYFRRHYYIIETVTIKLSHLTDSIHNRYRL